MPFADNKGLREVSAPPELEVQIVLSEAVHLGDLIGYSSGWKLATSSSTSTIDPQLIALQVGANTATIRAAPIARVKGFTGATAGDRLYVHASTAGSYTTTVPPTPRLVGRMMTADTAFVDVTRSTWVRQV